MKNLVLAALLTAMASTASAGIYSGIEYKSATITADAGDFGYNDVDLTTSGFETYIGYETKVSDTLTIDINAGFITGETSIGDSTGRIGVDTNSYNIEAGFENKFDDFTFYGKYEYNVMTSILEDIPSHGFVTGIRFDF